MNRKAFIFGAPNKVYDDADVCSDLGVMAEFLHSPVGGAWGLDEVVSEMGVTRAKVERAINDTRKTDYVFMYIAGYGELVKRGLPWPELVVRLTDGQEMTSGEFSPETPHRTFFWECGHSHRLGNAGSVDVNSPLLSVDGGVSQRTRFFDAFRGAEQGLIEVLGSSKRSTSLNDLSFTKQMIYESQSWAMKNKGILDLGGAVDLVTRAFAVRKIQDQPMYRGGRRLKHYPFALGGT